MIESLINNIKQAYRDLEAGAEHYRTQYANAARITPQAMVGVEPPMGGPGELQAGAMPPQAAEMAPPPMAKQPSFLDVVR